MAESFWEKESESAKTYNSLSRIGAFCPPDIDLIGDEVHVVSRHGQGKALHFIGFRGARIDLRPATYYRRNRMYIVLWKVVGLGRGVCTSSSLSAGRIGAIMGVKPRGVRPSTSGEPAGWTCKCFPAQCMMCERAAW
jgi:hypothetical protein